MIRVFTRGEWAALYGMARVRADAADAANRAGWVEAASIAGAMAARHALPDHPASIEVLLPAEVGSDVADLIDLLARSL